MTRGAASSGALAITLLPLAAACIPPRPSPTPAPTAPPAPTASPTASGVVVDPTLLSLLPSDIEGVALTADPDTASAIAAEGSIAPFVAAIALASAFGPLATDTPGDYVVVTVARLRPGTFSDLFYRGWRDTFDAAVCELAGGVDGHAETEISGRQTFIGTCAGGVHTYHVHLPTQDVIVSMQGLGDGRYAEHVIAGLTE